MAPRRIRLRRAAVAVALSFQGFQPALAAIMSRAAVLPSFVQMLEAPDDTKVISLQIGLRMQNIGQLEDKLKAVSEPRSPDYGKYMSAAEVNSFFKPADQSVDVVKKWLSDAGIEDISVQGSFINFATTVGRANGLLDARFSHFDVDGTDKIRTLQYSIPDELLEHIELVTPTTFFGKTKAQAPIPFEIARRQTAPPKPNCARLITPVCLEEMYNYGTYKADIASGSRVGFGSFLNQSARQEDLSKYLSMFNLPNVNFTSVLINGGQDHQDPRGPIGEANLDAQFMAAAIKTLPLTQFITGGSP